MWIALAGTAMAGPTTFRTWDDHAESFRRQVSIQTDVARVDQVVLVRMPQDDLRDSTLLGEDVEFFDEAGDSLSFEVDSWGSWAHAAFWVRLPDLRPPYAVIWMYWGRPDPSGKLSGKDTWIDVRDGVWHLEGCEDATCPDSTGQVNLDSNGTATREGIAGDGLDVSNGRLRFPRSPSLDLTVLLWIDDLPWGDTALIATDAWEVSTCDGGLQLDVGVYPICIPMIGYSGSEPHLVAVSYNADTVSLFADGAALDSRSSASGSNGDVLIGKSGGALDPFPGWVDEVQVVEADHTLDGVQLTLGERELGNGDWVQLGAVESSDYTYPHTSTWGTDPYTVTTTTSGTTSTATVPTATTTFTPSSSTYRLTGGSCSTAPGPGPGWIAVVATLAVAGRPGRRRTPGAMTNR